MENSHRLFTFRFMRKREKRSVLYWKHTLFLEIWVSWSVYVSLAGYIDSLFFSSLDTVLNIKCHVADKYWKMWDFSIIVENKWNIWNFQLAAFQTCIVSFLESIFKHDLWKITLDAHGHFYIFFEKIFRFSSKIFYFVALVCLLCPHILPQDLRNMIERSLS